MSLASVAQEQIGLWPGSSFPERVHAFPQLRYMGSKYRLLPWIHSVLAELDFESALDAFAGSGCVAYLLKALGKRVVAADFLEFSYLISSATTENSRETLSEDDLGALLVDNPERGQLIEQTFEGIFFTPRDLRFLDNVWANLSALDSAHRRALAISALVRSCVKRQPRGVFSVAGDPEKYKDGRRDLRLSLEEHFLESVAAYNATVFDNGLDHRALRGDVFEIDPGPVDLVYMDPPYVPRSDDNCYIKRYHFLEGLASYGQADDARIMEETKVKKLEKRYTPFSYRRTALDAFDRLFRRFAESLLVLSYSSNGYPDLEELVAQMGRYKGSVEVFEQDHRYHFGTHSNVSPKRAAVREYLIVGT
jgi:DNA adenine methylase/adenine-specific DNA-methyltransferase